MRLLINVLESQLRHSSDITSERLANYADDVQCKRTGEAILFTADLTCNVVDIAEITDMFSDVQCRLVSLSFLEIA